MALESGSFLNDLVTTNPASGDLVSQGDDHLRLVKTVLQGTFPALAGRAWRHQSKSSGYTVLTTDNMTVISATAALTLDLTAAATLGNGHMFVVVADDTVTVDPSGAETINGAATMTVPAGSTAVVFCTGSAFRSMLATKSGTEQSPVGNFGSLSVSAAATFGSTIAAPVANIGSLSVSAAATFGSTISAPVANIGSLSVSAAAVFGGAISAPVANIGSLSVSSIVSAEMFRNRNVTEATTTLTATAGAHMVITATGGAITVHLPASPTVGNHVQIHNATTREDHVIGRNAQPIMSLGEDMTIDKPHVTVSLVYVDATRGWRMV